MRFTHPFSLSVGLTVGAAALASPALAEPSPSSTRADVDALLARAKLALDTNDTKEQVASLRGLHAVAPEPRVTCALGMVERRIGQWPEAAEHLTKCVASPPPGMDHGYAEAEHHLAEARKSLYACFMTSQSPEHCSRFEASWNSAGTLRDAAVIGWIAAGGVGAATAIYHLTKPEERAPRLMIGVGPSSIRLEGTW